MANISQEKMTGMNSESETPEPLKPTEKITLEKADIDWRSFAKGDDPLLLCLEVLAALLGRPISHAALKSGLPLKNNRMTPDLLERAAERVGITTNIVHKKLMDLHHFTLPCILMLDGDKACLAVKRVGDDALEIIFPEIGKGSMVVSLEDLDKIYGGFAIFAQPRYRYDARSVDMEIDQPKSWFWGTFWKFWPIYGQVALSAILVNLFAIASPIFVMLVYDRVVPNNGTETLWFLAIGVMIVFGFDFLLKMLRVYYVDKAGKNADILLASRLFQHVMGMNLAGRPQSAGGFANQLREFESIRDFFSSATLVAFVDLPFILLFVVVIWLIGGALAWVPLLCVPLVLISTVFFQGPLSAWVRRSYREGAQKHALLVESINGLETIKSFGAESRIQRNWESFVAQSADSSNSLRFISSLAINFAGFIQQGAYVVVIIVGVYLIMNGELTTGALVACSILTARAIAPLTQVVSLLTRLNHARTSLEGLDKLVALPMERHSSKAFLNRPHLKGDIEFNDVTFSYPGQKVRALSNLSLSIKDGEKIGLVGRIGSGKSTIEKLILHLYTPESGSIKIDGTDIRQIDPADLRNKIGYVPQDIFLFFGTVRDNIAFGCDDSSDEAILRAAELSGVTEFTRHHPHGFDMLVGEGGGNLSGGQRQTIAVARALIRNPRILIMDEPTAMMDYASEERLIQRLRKVVADKTVILVSHRMPVLKLADRLIVIDGGRVVGDGPRGEVIKALTNSQIRSAL